MIGSHGDSFRRKSLSERVAGAVPSGGMLAPLRRRLKPLFERWLAPSNGGLRSELPGGEVVLVAPAYRHISWNPAEYAAFREAVHPGDVVLEAGANVGAYTVLFARWVGSSGRVIAFEPDPAAFDGLQRHVAMNGLADRVTLVPAAISDGAQRTLRFALGDSSGISRVALPNEGPQANVREVQALSIDDYCAAHDLSPQVIKIDVEGAELAALRGARSTIGSAASRLRLFVEIHPQLWPALGYAAADVRRECDTQRLTVEHLDGSVKDIWITEGVCLRLRSTKP